jgi:hypothetical protein
MRFARNHSWLPQPAASLPKKRAQGPKTCVNLRPIHFLVPPVLGCLMGCFTGL